MDNSALRPGALLGVEDRGIGIADADLPHVFERFRRGSNSREREGTAVSVWLPLHPPSTSGPTNA